MTQTSNNKRKSSYPNKKKTPILKNQLISSMILVTSKNNLRLMSIEIKEDKRPTQLTNKLTSTTIIPFKPT
jgi:hypothetical protein